MLTSLWLKTEVDKKNTPHTGILKIPKAKKATQKLLAAYYKLDKCQQLQICRWFDPNNKGRMIKMKTMTASITTLGYGYYYNINNKDCQLKSDHWLPPKKALIHIDILMG